MSNSSIYLARLPLWVLFGAALGIVVGLLFGSDAARLRPIGTSYVRLMEVVVFPYIISSLLHGLGRLSPDMAKRLFRCSWRIFLSVWGLTFVVIYLLAIAIPPVPPPSLIDTNLVESAPSLIDLLIPANPFQDLVENHLPAIVIFSIVFGVAIQRVKDKDAFLSILDLIRGASVTIWNWIVLLAPIGVFALFADTAGTVAPTELADLSIYLIAMLCGTGILAFWILPSVIAAFCPMSTREVLRELQGALVIAVVTSLSVAALPFIHRAADKLADRVGIDDPERGDIIQTTIAVSYPLAQLGNFFIMLFILFGAFYFRVTPTTEDLFALPLVTLLSGFGSPSSSVDAVAFLTQWLGFPDDSTNLYVGMMTITRYGQVLVSVMGFAFVTLLVTMTYYRKLNPRLPRLFTSLAIGIAAIGLTAAAARFVHEQVARPGVIPYLAYSLAPDITEGIRVTIEQPAEAGSGSDRVALRPVEQAVSPSASATQNNEAIAADTMSETETMTSASPSDPPSPAPPAVPGNAMGTPVVVGNSATGNDEAQMSILDRIESSGEIRVGFNPHIIPFSYLNDRGELVGFDIAHAYQLARDLNVNLRLVPFTWETLHDDLENHRIDLALSGIYATNDRLQRFNVSEPYLQSPIAFIVRAPFADAYLSREKIEELRDLTITVFDDPVMDALVKRLFPDAKIEVVSDYDELPQHPDLRAAIWTMAQARAWTAPRTDYTAVVPKDVGGQMLIAYLMPSNADQFGNFINYWLRVQNASGFTSRMQRRWIEGKDEAVHRRRNFVAEWLQNQFSAEAATGR